MVAVETRVLIRSGPKPIAAFRLPQFGANSKNCNENGCLKIKVGEDIISNDFDLAERFNDYFINVVASLIALIEQSIFDDLREHLRLKIPDNVVFELPEIDENFVFKYLSTPNTSKATSLDGIGPKLLKLSSGIITKSITNIINKCIIN